MNGAKLWMWIISGILTVTLILFTALGRQHIKADEAQARDIKECQDALAEKADRIEIEGKLECLQKDVGDIKSGLAELNGYMRGIHTASNPPVTD